MRCGLVVIGTHAYDAYPYFNIMESAADCSPGTTHHACQGSAGAQPAPGGVSGSEPFQDHGKVFRRPQSAFTAAAAWTVLRWLKVYRF